MSLAASGRSLRLLLYYYMITYCPLTLKTFFATTIHARTTCAEFNSNMSTKYGDIVSHEIDK